MKYRGCFLWIFVFTFAFSQENNTPESVAKVDSLVQNTKSHWIPTDSLLKSEEPTDNEIYKKNFAKDFTNKYKSKDFDYSTSKPRESLWDRVKRRIFELLDKLFGNISPTGTISYIDAITKILAIIVIGAILYFLIKFLASKNGLLFLGKSKTIGGIEVQDLHENIHEIDFAKEIDLFELEKKYRMAIRYRFLWTLKKLSDQNKIQWTLEKTNKDYSRELRSSSQYSEFLSLVKIFDYVWYGEFPLEAKQYEQFKSKFENFL